MPPFGILKTPPITFPPSRFGLGAHKNHHPTSFPDQSPPPSKSGHRSFGSRSSTTSLSSGYHSPMSYHYQPEIPPVSPSGEIEPGVYEIRSPAVASAVDLSAGDNKSAIVYPYHGQANQQWEFRPLGKGWSIKSVSSGLYLTVEKGLGSGVPVVASAYPVAWTVETGGNLGVDVLLARILWPNTEICWGIQEGCTPVRLEEVGQDRAFWNLRLVAQTTEEPNPPMHRHRSMARDSERDYYGRRSFSSDSDSDASYTVVKTITKTKTKKFHKSAGHRISFSLSLSSVRSRYPPFNAVLQLRHAGELVMLRRRRHYLDHDPSPFFSYAVPLFILYGNKNDFNLVCGIALTLDPLCSFTFCLNCSICFIFFFSKFARKRIYYGIYRTGNLILPLSKKTKNIERTNWMKTLKSVFGAGALVIAI